MYEHRNIEARSCNQFCSGKEMIIIYFEGVFVALDIRHSMRMHHIVISGLPGYKIIFNFCIKDTI